MKRFLVLSVMVAIVGLFTVTLVTAEGAQERVEGNAPASAQNQYYNGEKLSIEGTVKLTASGVKLNATDGKDYTLMYPRFLAESVQVKDGDSVTVEGFLVPGPRWDPDEDTNYLRVEMATIDGKEYDLAAALSSGYGPYGPRGGMHQHSTWKRGYGPGAGSAGSPRGGGYTGQGPGMSGRPGYRR